MTVIPRLLNLPLTALLFVASLSLFPPISAAQKPEPLERAWQEYQFLSLDVADKLFADVLKTENLPDVYWVEAKVGQAMVSQYRERNPDLIKAEMLYQEALAKAPAAEVRALIQSFLADLYASQGNQDQALKLLDALVAEHIDSVVGQDALIRRFIMTQGAYGTPESLAVARQTQADMERIQVALTQSRPYLVPLIHLLLGNLYFWGADPAESVAQFEKFTILGNADSTSYGSQASALYRNAKLCETELNQPERAGRFYRRLVEEYPNSSMSYYALEKAIALGALTRQEADRLRLGGLTPEILDELFAAQESEGEVSP